MKHLNLSFLFALAIAGLLLYSCTRSGPCEGVLRLENPIPDTTVAVGDTLFINLANPPMFVSSEGFVGYGLDQTYGYTNINSNIIDNPDDENKNTLLIIIGLQVGDAGIQLNAFSGCLENQTTITINVTE